MYVCLFTNTTYMVHQEHAFQEARETVVRCHSEGLSQGTTQIRCINRTFVHFRSLTCGDAEKHSVTHSVTEGVTASDAEMENVYVWSFTNGFLALILLVTHKYSIQHYIADAISDAEILWKAGVGGWVWSQVIRVQQNNTHQGLTGANGYAL